MELYCQSATCRQTQHQPASRTSRQPTPPCKMLWVRVDSTTTSDMIFPNPFSRFGAVVEKDICVNMVAQLLTAS